MLRQLGVWAAGALLVCAFARTSHAYDFEMQVQTVGFADTVRSWNGNAAGDGIARRAITQTLALSIWDLFANDTHRRSEPHRATALRGIRASVHTHLRVEHEFGRFRRGNGSSRSRQYRAYLFRLLHAA